MRDEGGTEIGYDVVVVVQDAVIGRREMLFVFARVATVKAWVSWESQDYWTKPSLHTFS
jgi:hypothetical protein